MDRREFFSWVRQRPRPAPRRPSLMLRDGTLRAAVPGEAEPALPALRPQGHAGHPHLPLRGDEPRRLVRLQAGPDRRRTASRSSRPSGPTSSSARSAGSASPTGSSASAARAGLWVSDLFPNLAEVADELTVIRSMVAETSNHTPATFQENSGFRLNGFPALGAWLSYGLGSEADDLPAFVVIPDAREFPAGGAINWTNGFLPARHQGVVIRPQGEPIDDLFPARPVSAEADRAAFADNSSSAGATTGSPAARWRSRRSPQGASRSPPRVFTRSPASTRHSRSSPSRCGRSRSPGFPRCSRPRCCARDCATTCAAGRPCSPSGCTPLAASSSAPRARARDYRLRPRLGVGRRWGLACRVRGDAPPRRAAGSLGGTRLH